MRYTLPLIPIMEKHLSNGRTGGQQTVCGMSVVGNEWETLKRFNLAELYQPTPKGGAEVKVKAEAEAIPKSVTKDDAKAEAREA